MDQQIELQRSFCGMKVWIKCSSFVCSDCGTTRGWVVIHPYSLHLPRQPRHTNHLNFLSKTSKIWISSQLGMSVNAGEWCEGVCACVKERGRESVCVFVYLCVYVRASVRARLCAKLQHNSSRTNKNLLNGPFDGGMLLKLNFLFAKVGIPHTIFNAWFKLNKVHFW